ncbi:hypothetical protein RBB50_009702 [Rhinocladiella similis]
MPTRTRSDGRDVHIYDLHDPSTELGGLLLLPGVTNKNFYSMVEIIILFEGPFDLQDENEVTIQRDNSPLRPGNYFVKSTQPFSLNDELCLLRTISQSSGSRVVSFAQSVRERDRQCLISGSRVPSHKGIDFFNGFQAAHIFPLAYEGHWIEQGFSRWITIQPPKGGSINSVQNGILLLSHFHQLFDLYNISINPDDDYKIVAFAPTAHQIEGKHLDRQLFTRPDAPADQLLRWHFRQAVLTNMRGAGEPVFEHDFPPGSDMIGDILQGPKAGERMEFELFSRFGSQMELFSTPVSRRGGGWEVEDEEKEEEDEKWHENV